MASIWTHIAGKLADGIEKQTVGMVGMFSSIGFILWLLIKEGGTATVESLITTLIIVSAALMGINSISSAISSNHTKSTTTRSEKITSTDGSSVEVSQSCEEEGL